MNAAQKAKRITTASFIATSVIGDLLIYLHWSGESHTETFLRVGLFTLAMGVLHFLGLRGYAKETGIDLDGVPSSGRMWNPPMEGTPETGSMRAGQFSLRRLLGIATIVGPLVLAAQLFVEYDLGDWIYHRGRIWFELYLYVAPFLACLLASIVVGHKFPQTIVRTLFYGTLFSFIFCAKDIGQSYGYYGRLNDEHFLVPLFYSCLVTWHVAVLRCFLGKQKRLGVIFLVPLTAWWFSYFFS